MILTTLLNIAIFQGIVVGVVILKSPFFKSKANNYLAYAIFTLSLLLLNLVFEILEVYGTVPFLRFIDNIEWALIFPVFIFLFIVNQVHHPVRHSKKIRWLFVPFFYSAIIGIFNDLGVIAKLYTIPESVAFVLGVLNFIELIVAMVFIPSLLIYAYRFIKHGKDFQERKWVLSLWLFVFTLLVSWVLAVLSALFFEYDVSYTMKILALSATFLIHWTAYLGIFKYRLAKDKEGINLLLANSRVSNFRGMTVSADLKKEEHLENLEFFTKDNPYFKKLEALCKNHHIYRDKTLNREKVAEQLEISPGYVSQLVNKITGKNLANYINHYRIEAVKGMILDPEFEKYSLLSMGLESGFTSKTTFYKAFKKATGMTPNAYRKAHT